MRGREREKGRKKHCVQNTFFFCVCKFNAFFLNKKKKEVEWKWKKSSRLLLAESVIIKIQPSQRPIIKKCHVKSCSSIAMHSTQTHIQPTAAAVNLGLKREISKRINLIAMGVLLVISILQASLNKYTTPTGPTEQMIQYAVARININVYAIL